MVKQLILKMIKLYQAFLSPYLGINCRFYPSCSCYAVEAIRKRGTTKGLIKSFYRLLRCNPFCKGGVDLP